MKVPGGLGLKKNTRILGLRPAERELQLPVK